MLSFLIFFAPPELLQATPPQGGLRLPQMGGLKKLASLRSARNLYTIFIYNQLLLIYTSFGKVVLAELNMLKGTLIGSLGKITGSVWKGKPTIRAKIFSKAPPQELQTASVRAFEKLNRISSAIAHAGFARIGLSAKGLHRHNAVARWLKPAIKNHLFEPANLQDVIPLGDNVRLSRFVNLWWSGQTFLEFRLVSGFVPPSGSYLHVVVFNDDGHTFFSHCDILQNFTTEFFIDTFGQGVYSVLAFVTQPDRHKRVANNLIYKRGNVMRYSYEEQPTGDTWINGKPIYQRSFTVTITGWTADSYYTTDTPDLDCENLISHELQSLDPKAGNINHAGSVLRIAGSGQPMPKAVSISFARLTTGRAAMQISCDNENLREIFQGTTMVFTLRYTKRSDLPVVDG